ncbi:MAG: MCE family protein [Bacteroidetes bacterium HGW-Bacteroidetes-13]|nr:MAG: MCE family protein [Bacteroidetes bacterium HGW-Bacteroidetes-13]
MKLSKEFKAALLVITALVVFIWGFNYLKGKNIFNFSTVYYVVYDDIQGLMTGTPVSINGFNVGKVSDIEFQGKTSKLLVTITMDKKITISKNSIAQIYESSLIGGKAVAIKPVDDDAPIAKSGDFLKGEIKPSFTDVLDERLSPLQDKIESLVINTDSVMNKFNNVFTAETQKNLQASVVKFNSTLGNLESITASLDKFLKTNEGQLGTSVQNIDTLTANLAKVSKTLSDAGLGETVADLQKSIQNLNALLQGINKGEGSLGKLTKDEALYQNLEKTSKQMELLLQDFRLNPKRYVHFSIFGKKAKTYQPFDESANQ